MWDRVGSNIGLDPSAKESHVPRPQIKPRLIDIRGHYLTFILKKVSPENQETLRFEVKSKFYARASFVMHSNLLKICWCRSN